MIAQDLFWSAILSNKVNREWSGWLYLVTRAQTAITYLLVNFQIFDTCWMFTHRPMYFTWSIVLTTALKAKLLFIRNCIKVRPKLDARTNNPSNRKNNSTVLHLFSIFSYVAHFPRVRQAKFWKISTDDFRFVDSLFISVLKFCRKAYESEHWSFFLLDLS